MSQVGMDAFPSQVLAPCSETAALFLPPTKLVEVPTQFWNRGLNEKFSGDQRRQNADKMSHLNISDLHKFLTCLWTVDENNWPVTTRGRCSSEIDIKIQTDDGWVNGRCRTCGKLLTAVIPTAAEDLRGSFDLVGVVGNWGIRACCCTCRTCCCTTEVALVFSDNLRHLKHHHCQVHLLSQWNQRERFFVF